VDKQRDLNLDLLRGVSALMIFMFHANTFMLTRNLYLFVNFFFLLSGYVLYDQIRSIKRVKHLRNFILARFFRIFPLFIFVLASRVTLDLLNRYFRNGDVRDFFNLFEFQTLLFSFALLQNFSISSTLLFIPAWSLSTEWITYLTISTILFLSSSKLIKYISVTGVLFLFCGYYFDIEYIRAFGFNYGLGAVGQGLFGFSIGLLVRGNLSYLKSKFVKINKFSLIFLTVFIVIFAEYVTNQVLIILFSTVVFTLFLIKFSQSGSGKSYNRTKKNLGILSYGVYLWHTVVLSIIQNLYSEINPFIYFVFGILLTIALSSISYKFIEKPFLSVSKRYSSKLDEF
jgi:peptidoglycan/LPS O-acetylase OafA/YrhL